MRFVVLVIGVVVLLLLLFPLLALAQSSASHTITLRIIAAPPPAPVLDAPEGAGPGYWLHTLSEDFCAIKGAGCWTSEWIDGLPPADPIEAEQTEPEPQPES